MAQPKGSAAFWELATWKTALSAFSALLVGVLFVVAGTWKITDPFGASVRLAQAQVPHSVSLPSAILLGVAETYAGVLLIVPRFRRWGAWLTGLLLVAFVIYIGANYGVLRGEECNCFPWVKRAVGPAFFIGDFIMLLLAFLAGLWTRPSESRRSAVLVLAAVGVFALVSFGVGAVRQANVSAPAWITADGKPLSLHNGRVFIYFFDPECAHCDDAARRLARHQWRDVTLIAVATAQPQFARDFLASTGFKARVSNDVEQLRAAFSFVDTPYAVALKDGRVKASITRFDQQEPEATLRSLGFLQ